MATRPINQYTARAVASIIPNIRFKLYDEIVYTNIDGFTRTQVINSPFIQPHNVASDINNGDGTYTLILHQIRMKNLAEVGLRPSWSAVDAAEITISNDDTLALSTRTTIYNDRLSNVSELLNSLLNSLSNPQATNLLGFQTYMGKNVLTNGRGTIIGFPPEIEAPLEHSINLFIDDIWIYGNTNPQWSDYLLG